MSNHVSDYQGAVRAFDSARARALAKIKMIEDVSSALNNHLTAFLGYQYEISMQASQYAKKVKFNMGDWPDAATLKSVLTEWHTAFVKMREAWANVPQDDRVGLLAPPSDMKTN
jgi:hypothetical protein